MYICNTGVRVRRGPSIFDYNIVVLQRGPRFLHMVETKDRLSQVGQV